MFSLRAFSNICNAINLLFLKYLALEFKITNHVNSAILIKVSVRNIHQTTHFLATPEFKIKSFYRLKTLHIAERAAFKIATTEFLASIKLFFTFCGNLVTLPATE